MSVSVADPVPFEGLADADLQLDRVYKGGSAGNRGDDPLAKLLPVGNAGGFRFMGSPTKGTVRAVALYTSGSDPDWPDRLDASNGTFTYYGDNKHPGRRLHDTPRKGNLFLNRVFAAISQGVAGRSSVPPILLFAKATAGADAVYRGLLVPGAATVPADEHLVAIWRTAAEQRFQNYRATFSVLDADTVTRTWIDSMAGQDSFAHAPRAWKKWRSTGVADRLLAPRTITYRTPEEQMPLDTAGQAVLAALHRHFEHRPHEFENCAAQIWMMMAPATEEIEVTRPSRDGGRDAIGRYALGPPDDRVRIDFALEAKCYGPLNSVGVREMSRLISRLRHRQFGVLITTSFVNRQAYQEIREDGHPVVVVSGRDIVELLKRRGWGDAEAVARWLEVEFPVGRERPRVDLRTGGVGLHVDTAGLRSET